MEIVGVRTEKSRRRPVVVRFDQVCYRGLVSVYQIYQKFLPCTSVASQRLSGRRGVLVKRIKTTNKPYSRGIYGYSLQMVSFLRIGD